MNNISISAVCLILLDFKLMHIVIFLIRVITIDSCIIKFQYCLRFIEPWRESEARNGKFRILNKIFSSSLHSQFSTPLNFNEFDFKNFLSNIKSHQTSTHNILVLEYIKYNDIIYYIEGMMMGNLYDFFMPRQITCVC